MHSEEVPMYESSETESSNPESSESENENMDEDLPPKFDLSNIQKRMEDGPASSSDEEEDEFDGDDENAEDSENENEENEQMSGWADAMAKVLSTGKNSKSTAPLLLSKAKKDSVTDPKDQDSKPREKASVRRLKKKELEEVGRKRPNIVKDRLKEKRLSKVATRGVVQLFNAVREQQKTLKTQLNKAGGSTFKRDKVYQNLNKESFLEVLTGKKNSKINGEQKVNGDVKPKLEIKSEDQEGSWSVLKDDYMMGAKLKDWDKDSDSN